MTKTIYTSLSDITELQVKIMQYIDVWVKKEHTPIPLQSIILEMTNNGVGKETTIKSLRMLIKKNYIRRAFTISNKTSFVQLRRV